MQTWQHLDWGRSLQRKVIVDQSTTLHVRCATTADAAEIIAEDASALMRGMQLCTHVMRGRSQCSALPRDIMGDSIYCVESDCICAFRPTSRLIVWC